VASLLVLPAVLAAGAAVALGSCDSSDEPREVLLLDWKRGTYEGVRLGDHSAKLQRVLGRPEQRGRNESFEPIGEDFYDIGGLTNFGSPDIGAVGDFETLRYRRRVFSTDEERSPLGVPPTRGLGRPKESESATSARWSNVAMRAPIASRRTRGPST
jgi:hypothetical protein